MAVNLTRSKRINIGKNVQEKDLNKENLSLLKRYKRDMQMRELSEKSIYNYERDIIQWFKYLYEEQFNPSVKELTEDEIEEFIFYCKEEGNNTERIKRRCSSISAFYKFLRRKKIVQENPMEFIIRPKKGLPVVVQTYLTREQYEDLKVKLKEYGDLRLQTYVMLSLSTMARVTAISNIKWNQINFEKRTIDDVLEKEGKIVDLYFSEEVKELLLALQEYNKQQNINSDYVFASKYKGTYNAPDTTTLRKWAKKSGQLIGVETLSPHDFRHSMATLMVNNGMPVEQVSNLLNHAGLDVTMKHYIKANKDKIQAERDKYSL